MWPDWSMNSGSRPSAAEVCLFTREVYNVGLSVFSHTSNMGRLVRHAAWHADCVVVLVSRANKPRACRWRPWLRGFEYDYDRRLGVRSCPARICCVAALARGMRDLA